MNPDIPRIDGLEHTIVHPGADNDVPWIPVRSQRNADGSDSHVWERWVAFSVDPLYLALFAKWDLDAAVVGQVTDSGRVVVSQKGRVFADIPAELLADGARMATLHAGALDSAKELTIERMAQRYADGLMSALRTPRR